MLKIKNPNQYYSNKILLINSCKKIINKLKKKGLTVGLCHGGFDLAHPGHFKHFESAKQFCDILVVSITADKFVTTRKGKGRPIYSENIRAYMVSCCRFVDYVVISPYKTATEIINELKPSVYIKGPDYINKQTPGIISERKAIKEQGGKIQYTTEAPMSTTKIVRYIKDQVKDEKTLIIVDRDGTIIENNDFPGKDDNWKEEIKLNESVVSLLSSLQTKYNTTTLVVSNQAGIARGLFSTERVSEVNKYIESLLLKRNIKIDGWEFCPMVDSHYAKQNPHIKWNREYVFDKTNRKPSLMMVTNGIKKLNISLNLFEQILVIGDREEDEKLAENINAEFIDVKTLD